MKLPRWDPEALERDEWLLVVDGRYVRVPSEQHTRTHTHKPEATDWEEDGSCVRCGYYKEGHLMEGDGLRFYCIAPALERGDGAEAVKDPIADGRRRDRGGTGGGA